MGLVFIVEPVAILSYPLQVDNATSRNPMAREERRQLGLVMGDRSVAPPLEPQGKRIVEVGDAHDFARPIREEIARFADNAQETLLVLCVGKDESCHVDW